MVPLASPYDELLQASRDLESRASAIQGTDELLVGEPELASLADDYLAWLAKAIELLPTEFRDKFRFEYSGDTFRHRIKHFLQSPGERNPFYNADENPFGFSPWNHPFEGEFRAPLLQQRQILIEAKQAVEGDGGYRQHLDLLERLARGIPDLLEPLRRRHAARPPFVIEDEYDLQDLFHGLLRVFFEDVRPEDYVPEHAGARSRVDFLLKAERIVVETKMTRAGLSAKEVGEQLIIDIERYQSHPDFAALVAVVYDPEKRIMNRRTLESDLSRPRDTLTLRVIVVQ